MGLQQQLRLGFLLDGGEAKALVPLKLLYLIHFAAFSTQTFLPLYFETTAHFSKFQIGILLSLPCICAIVSPPIWGALADVLNNHKFVHVCCLVSAALLMFSIRFVTSFPLMCIMIFLANFQTQPTWSLLDQLAMALLTRVGGNYGKQRLYGAVGYGAGGYFAGVVAAAVGIAWCFNMVVALSAVSLFILVRHIPALETDQSEDDVKPNFLQSMRQIARKPDVSVLFVVVVLAGIMGGLIDSFLVLYLFNLANNNANLVGIVIATQTISELPLFFHAHSIIERFGTPKCILFGLIGYGIRFTVYTFVQNPWFALPIECLHGLTFGLSWAAFTNYIYQAAPNGTQGTMIGLLAAVQKGIGGGLGTLVGGFIYQEHGARVMWAIAGFGLFPISLVCGVAFAYLAHAYVEQIPVVVRRRDSVDVQPITVYGTLDLQTPRTTTATDKPLFDPPASMMIPSSAPPTVMKLIEEEELMPLAISVC